MKSKYLLLAKLKARYDLERDSGSIMELVKAKYEHRREIRRDLLKLYDFIPEKHVALYSPHSIVRNQGCGCALCKRMHEYAKAKLHLHYFKRTFNADFGMENLMSHGESTIPLSCNFYALYSEYTTKLPEGEEAQTQLQFFNWELESRKQHVRELRNMYKATQAAIAILQIS